MKPTYQTYTPNRPIQPSPLRWIIPIVVIALLLPAVFGPHCPRPCDRAMGTGPNARGGWHNPRLVGYPQPGPEEAEQFNQRFKDALALLEKRDLDGAIAAFRKLAEDLPPSDMQNAAIYNIACAYSLKKDLRNGALWLARAVKNGFRDGAHLATDSDLDNIRKEPLVQKLFEMIDAKRFTELDDLSIDAMEKQFYGNGSGNSNAQPGELTAEQKRKLEALRKEMYDRIEADVTATRERLRKMVDETIERLAREAAGSKQPQPQPAPTVGSAPFLGIEVEAIDDNLRDFMGIPAGEGVVIRDFAEGSPAPAAGIQKMDVLLRAAGRAILTADDLAAVVKAMKPGDSLALKLLRDSRSLDVTVKLAGKVDPTADGRPEWARTVPHVPGQWFAGIGTGANADAAKRSAHEILMTGVAEVMRKAAARYMLSSLHPQQQKQSESYLASVMHQAVPSLHGSVKNDRTDDGAGKFWSLARLPYQVAEDALLKAMQAEYHRIDGPSIREPDLRFLMREEHDRLIQAGGVATGDAPAMPEPVPGDRLPALQHGALGLRVATGETGVDVREVLPESPALKAGMQVGDVIVAIDGTAVKSSDDLRAVLEKRFVGDVLKVSAMRAGKRLELNVTIGRRD